MKKLFLLTSLSLLGLSVQANDWRTEPQTEQAETLARDFFWNNPAKITQDDITRAMKRFPTFLTWEDATFGMTITHVIAQYLEDPELLRHLLGFTPDITKKNSFDYTPVTICEHDGLKQVFEEYQQHPWKHDATALDEHTNVPENNKAASLLSRVFSGYVLAPAAVITLLSLIYLYAKKYKTVQVS